MASTERPYFQFYPKDFASDGKVEAMSTTAVGAYILLLCKAWLETPPASLPNDDCTLARWSRVSSDEWAEVKTMVLAAFTPGAGNRLYQKRLRAEYDKLVEKSNAASQSAAKRWGKSERNANALPTHCEGNARAYESESKSGSGSSSPDLSSLPSAIYAAYPRHVGPRKAMAEIAGALNRIGNGEAKKPPDIPEWPPPNPAAWLLDRTKQYAEATAGWHIDERQYIPHPSTFFHQDRYCDDPKQWQRNGGNGSNRQAAGSGPSRAPASTAASRGEYASDPGEARRL